MFTHQLYLKSDRLEKGSTLGECFRYFINSDNLNDDNELKELLERKVDGYETLGDGTICIVMFSRREPITSLLWDIVESAEVPATLIVLDDYSTLYSYYDWGLGAYEDDEYYLEITRGEPYYSCAEFFKDEEAVLRKILAVFPEAIELVVNKFDSLRETHGIVSYLCETLPEVPESSCEFLLVTGKEY